MKTKVIALLLAIALMLSSLSGCGGPPTEQSGNPTEQTESTKDLTLSPETTAVTTADGITVDVGDFVLDGEAELTVAKQPVEEHKEEGYQIEAYDISLGDMHELDDFITIRIPYDTGFCEEGQDPARCVGAKYKNETTGEWEDVLFEVDAAANELVIYTDHLSTYGVFYVENEGKRNAYITDVSGSGFYIDKSTAIGFAERIAADDPTVMESLAELGIELSSVFFDESDRLDNAITIATVGDVPDWLSTEIQGTNLTLFSAIGYVSTCKSLMEVAIKDSVGGGADTGAVLNLIRDVSSKVTTYWADVFTSAGSGALSVGMGGVLIIDKMLTAFAEEAASTKLEDIEYVYHYFTESSTRFGHKPMTAKDWRARVIEVIDKYPNDPEIAINALEADFRKYASEFFELKQDQQYEVATDVPNVTVKRIPHFTAAEQDQMIERYISHLKENVMPAVLKSVENYMIKKVAQQQLQAIKEVKDYYNTSIRITITEKLPEGAESPCIGYKFRFAPLDDTAVVDNWTGTWQGPPLQGSATLLGFMMAGFPHTVEFFPPDADMQTAEPEFVVPFVISTPEINIEFSGGLTVDDLVGTYSGTVTATAVRVTEEMYQLYINEQLADEYGDIAGEIGSKADCDAALAQYIDQVQLAQEITIVKTGENTCTVSGILISNDNIPMSAPAVFENEKLILTTEEGTTEIVVTEKDGSITLESSKAVFLASCVTEGMKQSFLVETDIYVVK